MVIRISHRSIGIMMMMDIRLAFSGSAGFATVAPVAVVVVADLPGTEGIGALGTWIEVRFCVIVW